MMQNRQMLFSCCFFFVITYHHEWTSRTIRVKPVVLYLSFCMVLYFIVHWNKDFKNKDVYKGCDVGCIHAGMLIEPVHQGQVVQITMKLSQYLKVRFKIVVGKYDIYKMGDKDPFRRLFTVFVSFSLSNVLQKNEIHTHYRDLLFFVPFFNRHHDVDNGSGFCVSGIFCLTYKTRHESFPL